MLQTIADQQPIDLQGYVVAPDLVKNLLRERHGRGLVFHNQKRFAAIAENHAVASTFQLAHLDGYLVAYPSGRIMQVFDKEMHKMLPYPLFGSEFHPAPTLCIPNFLQGGLGVQSGAHFIGWQIQSIHSKACLLIGCKDTNKI
jgi:hypothetical protein